MDGLRRRRRRMLGLRRAADRRRRRAGAAVVRRRARRRWVTATGLERLRRVVVRRRRVVVDVRFLRRAMLFFPFVAAGEGLANASVIISPGLDRAMRRRFLGDVVTRRVDDLRRGEVV